MRILVIDPECLGLDFALRCAAADHDVRWFRDNKGKTREGEGFRQITIIDDWRSSMPWAKDGLIVVTGNCKYLTELDRYREFGFRIFAPTVKSAELEIRRDVGMKAMEAAGIEVPPYTMFSSLEEAQAFARKSSDAFVFKTMGDEADKSLSYVSADPADLVGWLAQKIKRGLKLRGPCMLQEKIDMLAEVGVSGWFGPEGFLPDKWQICFEHKKLYPGDIGQNTGEQGTVTQYVEADKMATEVLMPMEPILKVLGHRGDFALGAGIDKKGKVWPFEWTARLGWPAFYLQVASHKGDVAQWMRDLLDGKDTLRVSRDACIGVVLSQPPYPKDSGPADEVEGNPIHGIKDNIDNIHLASVMLGKGPVMKDDKVAEGPLYQTTGPYVMVATGLARTVEKARNRVYTTIGEIKMPNLGYRNDIGAKLEDCLPALHRFGFCTDLEYS